MHEEFVEPMRDAADVVVGWPDAVPAWVLRIEAELARRAPQLQLA